MHIALIRYKEIGEATIGEAIVNSPKGSGSFTCATLEPKQRDIKIKGKTAIPPGTYKVKYRYSQKFGKNMPFIEDVPNFSGIMFHVGNELKDTEGCILLGTHRYKDKAYIYKSKLTFDLFDAILKFEPEDITVTIVDAIRHDIFEEE